MTAVQVRVDAAAVTLQDLNVLEAGSTVVWNGLTARHGEMFSPLERETPQDAIALVDQASTDPVLHTMRMTDQGPNGWRFTRPGVRTTVAEVLATLADLHPFRPIVRFTTGRELFEWSDDADVPAIAVWTGPAVPAWSVPVDGVRPDLRGQRVSWQDTLSHRVTGTVALYGDGELTAAQDERGRWVLTDTLSGRTVELEPVPHRTLADVLAWMTAELHTLLEPTPFKQMGARPFAIADPDGVGPLTVRMW